MVTEPIMKSVRGVTGLLVAELADAETTLVDDVPCTIAIAAPGIFVWGARVSMNAASVWSRASFSGWAVLPAKDSSWSPVGFQLAIAVLTWPALLDRAVGPRAGSRAIGPRLRAIAMTDRDSCVVVS